MQLFKSPLSLLTIFSTVILAALAADEPPKELVIDVVQKAESCKLKAGPGDRVSVHYVRSTVY
jgi:hypothetical protein